MITYITHQSIYAEDTTEEPHPWRLVTTTPPPAQMDATSEELHTTVGHHTGPALQRESLTFTRRDSGPNGFPTHINVANCLEDDQ